MICAACFAWLVALYYAVTMSGLLITVVQEKTTPTPTATTSTPPAGDDQICKIVQIIPLGTLCILGGLGLLFSLVSCVVCCCCRAAGSISF